MAQANPAYPLVTNQLLTASYVAMGSFRISEESLSALEIRYITGAGEAGTGLQFIVDFSADNTNWIPENSTTLASGINTLGPIENRVVGGAGATTYTGHYFIPICARFVRVRAKETGVGANFGRVTIIATVSPFSGQSRNLQSITATIGGTITTTSKTPLTPSAPTAATVGVASAQALAANANRKGLVMINTSGNTISLAFGAPAVLNSGITLAAGAGFGLDEYSFNLAAVNAIASGAASNLSIQEFTT